MSLLSVHDLCVERRGERVLDGVSFEIGAGECVGLIGPNGAGKTTLLRALLGLLPFRGRSTLAALSHSRRAKEVAWMPQSREIAWPVTVETVVMLGRTPHAASLGRPGAQDIRAVETALDRMELTAMRDRPATELSGGEQARVLIARALAQETPLLLADEPIAGLDPAHQIATMQTFAALAAQGKSCLVSLHDLGLAGRHCTRLILLGQGGLVADGPPAEVLSPDLLARIFGITAFCQQTDQGLLCQPLEVIR